MPSPEVPYGWADLVSLVDLLFAGMDTGGPSPGSTPPLMEVPDFPEATKDEVKALLGPPRVPSYYGGVGSSNAPRKKRAVKDAKKATTNENALGDGRRVTKKGERLAEYYSEAPKASGSKVGRPVNRGKWLAFSQSESKTPVASGSKGKGSGSKGKGKMRMDASESEVELDGDLETEGEWEKDWDSDE